MECHQVVSHDTSLYALACRFNDMQQIAKEDLQGVNDQSEIVWGRKVFSICLRE